MWVKRRLAECDAVESMDFSTLPKNVEAENQAFNRIDYVIQLSTAKEMAMLERNKIGKRVWKYFISVEDKFKQASPCYPISYNC